mmetsp:Transcript_34213/g.68118  ORF Transcript_34213/g.68118 Transcript_34213/m.68118 type:complete len:179 (+) Transcript_34213:55-591(+)
MDLNISWITWCMKGCVSAHCSACASYNYFALAQCGDASFAKPACTQQQPSTASWSTKTVWSDVLTREMELDLQASGGGVASCSWSKRRTWGMPLQHSSAKSTTTLGNPDLNNPRPNSNPILNPTPILNLHPHPKTSLNHNVPALSNSTTHPASIGGCARCTAGGTPARPRCLISPPLR